MKKVTQLILIIMLCWSTQHVQAQSFGSMTQSGWGASLGIQSENNQTRLELDLGLMSRPTTELGLKVVRLESSNDDSKGTGIGGYAAGFPLRQNEDTPVTASISSSFVYYFFSGGTFDAFSAAGVDLNASEFTLIGSLFHEIQSGSTVRLIPGFEVGWQRQEFTARAGSRSEKERNSLFFWGIGGRFAWGDPEASNFAVAPLLRFSEGDTDFQISLIMMIPN